MTHLVRGRWVTVPKIGKRGVVLDVSESRHLQVRVLFENGTEDNWYPESVAPFDIAQLRDKALEEIVAWLRGLEGTLTKTLSMPIQAEERAQLEPRRGIYDGIADDIDRKWPYAASEAKAETQHYPTLVASVTKEFLRFSPEGRITLGPDVTWDESARYLIEALERALKVRATSVSRPTGVWHDETRWRCRCVVSFGDPNRNLHMLTTERCELCLAERPEIEASPC